MKFRNKKLIFEIIAAVGVVATGISAAIGMKKAKEKIDIKEKEEGELSNVDKIACSWHYFVPAGISACGVILCNHFNNKDTINYVSGLFAGYNILKDGIESFRKEVIDIYGPDAITAIEERIIVGGNSYPRTPTMVGCINYVDIDGEPEPKRIFYDPWCKRYFESTWPVVLMANFHLARNYNLGGQVSINEFYRFLGISEIENGDNIGWSQDGGLAVLDFDNGKLTLSDGTIAYNCAVAVAPDVFLDDF